MVICLVINVILNITFYIYSFFAVVEVGLDCLLGMMCVCWLSVLLSA
jgi:hypothetical protein